jgi:hypothetical protein
LWLCAELNRTPRWGEHRWSFYKRAKIVFDIPPDQGSQFDDVPELAIEARQFMLELDQGRELGRIMVP